VAVWWVGDAMGILLVAPFLLASSRGGPFHAGLFLATRAGADGAAGRHGARDLRVFQNRLRLEYLVLPLIMTIAWRFRLRGAAPAALIASGSPSGQ